MTINYFLPDYGDETIAAEAPTLEAWAKWLTAPTEGWGRTDPAKPGDVFRGTAAVEVGTLEFAVGEEIPHLAVAATWFYVRGEPLCCGGSVEEAITDLDPGDDVEIVCMVDYERHYRFDIVDGVAVLVDTDPTTAPVSAEAVREHLQPSLI